MIEEADDTLAVDEQLDIDADDESDNRPLRSVVAHLPFFRNREG